MLPAVWVRILLVAALASLVVTAAVQVTLPSAQADGGDDREDRKSAPRDRDDEGEDDDQDERSLGNGPRLHWVVRDRFRDQPDLPLADHDPDIDEVGGGWLPAGDWRISQSPPDSVRNKTGLDLAAIASLDAQIPEIDLSAVLTHPDADSHIGLVFRYVDQQNHFRAVHDGKRLLLQKVVAGQETTLARKEVKWKEGEARTLLVRVKGNQIAVFLDEKRILGASDAALAGNLRAGLYHFNGLKSRITDLKVAALGPPPGAVPPEPVTPVVVDDSFTDVDGTSLAAHTPEVVADGGWSELTGAWAVHGGRARLESAGAGDPLAFVRTGLDEADIYADVTWNGGLAGLSWGVDDAGNYSIVFFDGAGSLVAGRIDATPPFFHELGRVGFPWSLGETKRMRVRVNQANPGELPPRYNARIYVDDSVVRILAINAGMSGPNKGAGLFAKGPAGGAASTFDNFRVRVAVPLAQADPVLPVVPPPPPPPVVIPSGAWVYDSFNEFDATQIQWRPPDLDPSGSGWSIHSGTWDTKLFQARQKAGGEGDAYAFIDTGRDQYDMRAKIRWDGGRLGVVFGAHGTDGRNLFLFWKHSDDRVILGKVVGGVFFMLGDADVKWKVGQTRTLRVVVEGDHLKAYVQNRKVFDLHDQELPFATFAGLFQRLDPGDRWEDFLVRFPPGVAAPTPTPTPTPVPPVVFDSFDSHYESGNPETGIAGRAPEIGPSGATWAASGWAPPDWRSIQSGDGRVATQRAPGDLEWRLHVETGTADQDVRSVVTRNGGLAGLVARYGGEASFVFTWVDGAGNLTLARLDSGFVFMGSAPAASVGWTAGESRVLRLVVASSGPLQGTRVFVDGVPVIVNGFTGLAGNTSAGLFSRNTADDLWDDFEVKPAP
jgi:hypothetical protein